MNWLKEFVLYLYVYCTDFCMSAANLIGLSYYEVNFYMFCVAYPLLGIFSTWLYFRQRARLRKRTSRS
ncbi:MAG: hypothetical protein EBZ67_02855 [Chitinophagia bacterium]|nr:hypothetical protein [Chitinophagia bacterium]